MKLILVQNVVNFFTQMCQKIRDLFHVLWYYSFSLLQLNFALNVCSITCTCTVDLINKIPFIFDMQTVVGTQIFIPQNFFIKENSGSCVLIIFKTHCTVKIFLYDEEKLKQKRTSILLSLPHWNYYLKSLFSKLVKTVFFHIFIQNFWPQWRK